MSGVCKKYCGDYIWIGVVIGGGVVIVVGFVK